MHRIGHGIGRGHRLVTNRTPSAPLPQLRAYTADTWVRP
jgi:hypothetical protein